MRGANRRSLAATALDHLSADDPFVLVDVGARGGLEPLWGQIQDQILAVGFEPDESHQLTESPNQRYLRVALWERSEPLTLYVARDPGKTSVFRPNMDTVKAFPVPERFETVSEVAIPSERVQTLDQALRANGVPPADFIKIDTQGSELPILRGGPASLGGAVGLKTEVEFVELYRGQPLFAEVDEFARGAGYELIDLRRVHWRREGYKAFPGRGQVVFGDALYLKRQEGFLAELEGADPGTAQNRVLKFVVACMVYGVHDYAVTLLEAARHQGRVEESLHRALMDAILSHDRRTLAPNLPRLHRLVRKAHRALDRGQESWGHSDGVLGNR